MANTTMCDLQNSQDVFYFPAEDVASYVDVSTSSQIESIGQTDDGKPSADSTTRNEVTADEQELLAECMNAIFRNADLVKLIEQELLLTPINRSSTNQPNAVQLKVIRKTERGSRSSCQRNTPKTCSVLKVNQQKKILDQKTLERCLKEIDPSVIKCSPSRLKHFAHCFQHQTQPSSNSSAPGTQPNLNVSSAVDRFTKILWMEALIVKLRQIRPDFQSLEQTVKLVEKIWELRQRHLLVKNSCNSFRTAAVAMLKLFQTSPQRQQSPIEN